MAELFQKEVLEDWSYMLRYLTIGFATGVFVTVFVLLFICWSMKRNASALFEPPTCVDPYKEDDTDSEEEPISSKGKKISPSDRRSLEPKKPFDLDDTDSEEEPISSKGKKISFSDRRSLEPKKSFDLDETDSEEKPIYFEGKKLSPPDRRSLQAVDPELVALRKRRLLAAQK